MGRHSEGGGRRTQDKAKIGGQIKGKGEKVAYQFGKAPVKVVTKGGRKHGK